MKGGGFDVMRMSIYEKQYMRFRQGMCPKSFLFYRFKNGSVTKVYSEFTEGKGIEGKIPGSLRRETAPRVAQM